MVTTITIMITVMMIITINSNEFIHDNYYSNHKGRGDGCGGAGRPDAADGIIIIIIISSSSIIIIIIISIIIIIISIIIIIIIIISSIIVISVIRWPLISEPTRRSSSRP